MSSLVARLGLALVSCSGIFVLDQYAKRVFFEEDRSFFLLSGWIQSIHHRNFGIAFNIPIPLWLILGITGIACLGVIAALVRTQKNNTLWTPLLLGTLLGGAFGNAFDRIHFGFVRDWLLLWHRSAINLADVGVLLGLIGLFFVYRLKTTDETAAR